MTSLVLCQQYGRRFHDSIPVNFHARGGRTTANLECVLLPFGRDAAEQNGESDIRIIICATFDLFIHENLYASCGAESDPTATETGIRDYSFTVTVLISVYCCNPYSPSSRPIPDCLNPPNGARVSRTL
jgi:hypothetical protein